MVVVTHYQRLLDYIVPDFVHVLVDGRIVRSGGKELALELEAKGYDWLETAAAAAVSAEAPRAAARDRALPRATSSAARPTRRRAGLAARAARATAIERFAERGLPDARARRTGGTRTSRPIARTVVPPRRARPRGRRVDAAAPRSTSATRSRGRRARLRGRPLRARAVVARAQPTGVAGRAACATRSRDEPRARCEPLARPADGATSAFAALEHGVPRGRRVRRAVAAARSLDRADPPRLRLDRRRRRADGRASARCSCCAGAAASATVVETLRRRRRAALLHERGHRDRARGRRASSTTTSCSARATRAFHVGDAARCARAATQRFSDHSICARRRAARATTSTRGFDGRGRRVRARRPLRGRRHAARRQPHAHRPRAAALHEPRALQGRRSTARARGVFNGTHRSCAPGRAEDRRAADEQEPAALARGAGRHQARSSRSSPTT